MHVFYAPHIDIQNPVLSVEESQHCTRVLRLKNSDLISLIDGKGGFYKAEIINAKSKEIALKLLDIQQGSPRKYHLHIAIAPTKNIDRLEWFLEKATEIGISEITPLIAARSERKVLKTERLNKVIVSAMKQSLQAYMPQLNEALSFKDFIQRAEAQVKLIAHCVEDDKQLMPAYVKPGDSVLILIGPEGDFSITEIEQALQNKFKAISLGDSRLRTETAGIAACLEMSLLNRV